MEDEKHESVKHEEHEQYPPMEPHHAEHMKRAHEKLSLIHI